MSNSNKEYKKLKWFNHSKSGKKFNLESTTVIMNGFRGSFLIEAKWDKNQEDVYELKYKGNLIASSYDRNSLKKIANDLINGIVTL